MSDFYESLKTEFEDSDYRYGYAESFLNTKLATQIKTLREQRGKTQVEIGALMGIKQPGYRRFEDINHSVWKTDTLWNIARALGVRVDISFKTFGSLLDDKKRFTKESLELPEFEEDPAFADQVAEPEEVASVAETQPSLSLAGLGYPYSTEGLAQQMEWFSSLHENANQALLHYLNGTGKLSDGTSLAGLQSRPLIDLANPNVSLGETKALNQTDAEAPIHKRIHIVPRRPAAIEAVNPNDDVEAA